MPNEINFEFIKDTISQNVIDYFNSKILNNEEKDWFRKMVRGINLKKAEANQLVRSIVSAMVIITDEETEEITIL